jgi:transposase-like protein
MTQKRTRYSADFKAKVALEALKEQKTMTELSGEYELHSNQIIDWKKSLKENASQIFETNKGETSKEQEKLIERLYAQIGQLKVELDWLKKKVGN